MTDIIPLHPKTADAGPIRTPTHDEISQVLQECHSEGLLAVIRGGFGIGKTYALERYKAAHQCDVAMVTLDPTTRSMTTGLIAVCEELAGVLEWFEAGCARMTTYTTSSAHAARQAIQRFSRDISQGGGRLLVIVDEAQYARPDLLEVLRSLHDKGLFGLVVSGNEQLFNARRGRMVAADFGALLSRAHHVIDRPAPLPEDIAAVLDAYRIKGAEARKLLARCAEAGGLREAIHVIEKAREISEGSLVGLLQLKAAAASTGLTATGLGRR